MIRTTTLTQKWQMTLPKKIRVFLGLKKPGMLFLELVDAKERLIKISEKPSFMSLAGILPTKNKHQKELDLEHFREYLEKNYKRQ